MIFPYQADSQPEPENRCPDCLWIKLEGTLVQPQQSGTISLQSNQTTTETVEIDLYLTINFNEYWQQLPGGRVKFGLKGGELRLNLENGKIPYKSRLSSKLELFIQKERQDQQGNENQSSVEGSLTETKPSIKADHSSKETSGRTDNFHFTSCQLTTKGSEEMPAWAFELHTGEPVLKGLRTQEKIGTLSKKVSTDPCGIKATFTVSIGDVRLTDAEGLWWQSLSQEKRIVLDRALAKLLIKHNLDPYLSRVELRYV